jgi:hypothetical protein
MLCEVALAAALEYQGKGMDIRIGYTGGKIMGGKDEVQNLPVSMNAAALTSALAQPYAIFLDGRRPEALPRAELPTAPQNTAIFILALPRTFIEISGSEPSALEKFLKKREVKQEVDIVFLYNVELEDAARSCVNRYNGISGVHAGKAAVLINQQMEEGKR